MAHLNDTLTVLGLELQLGSPDMIPTWVAEDERVAIYANDDDVDEPYTMGGISAVGCVFLVVLCSGFLGLAIFYCSYKSEKQNRQAEMDEEEDEKSRARRDEDIESCLFFKPWDTIAEDSKDEMTRNSSSSEDEESQLSDPMKNNGNNSQTRKGRNKKPDEAGSTVSPKDYDTSGDAWSQPKNFWIEDSPLFLLQQKPRCVLCSKFFMPTDVVSCSKDSACMHNFHRGCIVSWLQKNEGCPVCRKSYFSAHPKAKKMTEESETGITLEENNAIDDDDVVDCDSIWQRKWATGTAFVVAHKDPSALKETSSEQTGATITHEASDQMARKEDGAVDTTNTATTTNEKAEYIV